MFDPVRLVLLACAGLLDFQDDQPSGLVGLELAIQQLEPGLSLGSTLCLAIGLLRGVSGEEVGAAIVSSANKTKRAIYVSIGCYICWMPH